MKLEIVCNNSNNINNTNNNNIKKNIMKNTNNNNNTKNNVTIHLRQQMIILIELSYISLNYIYEFVVCKKYVYQYIIN